VNHNNHKIPKSVKNTLKLEKGKTNWRFRKRPFTNGKINRDQNLRFTQ
jgi:hypothetical protein